MTAFEFHNPRFLFLLLLLPLYWLAYWRQQRLGAVRFSSLDGLEGLPVSLPVRLRHLTVVAGSLALAALTAALARPRLGVGEELLETEGINISLAVDLSTSMLAEDFTVGDRRMNRLEVLKPVIRDFIGRRRGDRIGLVAFAGRAYPYGPLTTDHEVLSRMVDRLEIGMLEDGTAIGMAIVSSLNQLRAAEGGEKVILLLTDGINNTGKIDPVTAAEMARGLGVRIYAVGAGSRDPVPYPAGRDARGRTVYRTVSLPIDDDELQRLADLTGGAYFRAEDTAGLEEIYRQIDQLEAAPIRERRFTEYRELFPAFIFAGLALLLTKIVLRETRLGSLP